MRPARSWLWVPAHDRRKVEKGAAAGADVAVLDLEDGTPHERKEEARQVVAAALVGIDFGRSRRFVRINGLETTLWRADAEAACGAGADGIVVPKASSPARLCELAALVRELCAGRALPEVAPIVTEDVEGVFAAGETIAADPLVETVLWGSEDLSASLGAWRVKDDDGRLLDVFRVVRSLVLLEGARRGKRVIDTPYLALRDADGLAREARDVAAMGFAGKQAIHPDQIPVLNEAFTPPEAAVREAAALVAAFEEEGGAVVRFGDTMADSPHLLRARRLLALAESLEGSR